MSHRPDGASEVALPLLDGAGHAAAAIRLSAPPRDGRAVVALLGDGERRILLAIAVEDVPPTSVPQVVDLVLAVAGAGKVATLVVGIVDERLPHPPRDVLEALRSLPALCAASEVELLGVLAVGPRGYRSLLGATP